MVSNLGHNGVHTKLIRYMSLNSKAVVYRSQINILTARNYIYKNLGFLSLSNLLCLKTQKVEEFINASPI